MAKRVLRPLMYRLWEIEIIGAPNIPATGPVVIAPNHVAFIDSILLVALLERQTLGVGKAEYLDSWKTRHVLPGIGMIPLDRSGGDASQHALGQARDALDDGKAFVVYPEGTRTRDGYLHRGHTGVARLALGAGCPIVPAGICGTEQIQPSDQRLPQRGVSITIEFGQPIPMDRFDPASHDDGRLFRRITDEVMFEISKLSGQTYVDWYHGQEPVAAG